MKQVRLMLAPIVAILAFVIGGVAQASTNAIADVTTQAENISTMFGSIFAIALLITVAGIALSILLKVRGKGR